MFATERDSFNLFGRQSCEDEIVFFGDSYENYYYAEGRFNAEALERSTYLIIGRRGSGKTSLGKYFGFQQQIQSAVSIDVDEPKEYEHAISELGETTDEILDLSISHLERIWEYLLWSLIFDRFRKFDQRIETACALTYDEDRPAHALRAIIRNLSDKLIGTSGRSSASRIEDVVRNQAFREAKRQVLSVSQNHPVIISVDTLERYDKRNAKLMMTTAGLIQCAHAMNVRYASRGIHVKVFVAAEIFPHMKEAVITNPAKFIDSPLYLQWRPKDLARLICWRAAKSMEFHGERMGSEIDWGNPHEVIERLWRPMFGATVTNMKGRTEDSFSYILRHTQMGPRQTVTICNAISKAAGYTGGMPDFSSVQIATVVNNAEKILADDIISAYSQIYPGLSGILDALRLSPMVFKGSYLDSVAKTTKSHWPDDSYSLWEFRRLVGQLGIVGRVRSRDQSTGIIAADFEYSIIGRLGLRPEDDCVIHPMFYSTLGTKTDSSIIVYPFPDHPDFAEFV